MPKRPIDGKINDEEPEDRGTFQRATEEVLKTRVIKKAVRRNKKGGGDTGFPKATTVEESPLSFLSKELTEPGTSKRSGAASKFTFVSKNTNTADDVGASKDPFSGLKGFANTTTAGKSPFSFLSGTSNASDAKEKFTFGSPIMVAQKAEAEHETSSNYVTNKKQLKQSLTELLITQIDENLTCDLTPLFDQYLHYLKEMDEVEDKLAKLVSNGAQKVSLMLTPFSEFTYPVKPFSTSTSGGADYTTSSQTSGDKPTSCNTSTSSIAATTNLPLLTVRSFGTSALISADKPSIFGGTTKSEKNDFNFALKTDQNNTTSSNLEKKSRNNHILFGNKIPSCDNNNESEKKPPALSFTSSSTSFAFTNKKPLALSVIPEESGGESTPCNTSTSSLKFTVGSFGTTAQVSADKTKVFMMNDENDEEPEDRGTFQRATDEVLKTRVIKKAVRRNKEGTGLFTGFKGFAKTTTAGKYPFSFLSGTTNASDAGKELEKSRNYVSKQKQLNQSLTELLKTQIDENPVCDLNPHFKEMDKDEDKLKKLVSNGAQKVPLMVTPFSEFTFPVKPFSATILILCVLVFLYLYVFYE